VPGGIDIADWLFEQPEFNEATLSKGVRFVALCRQNLVSLDEQGATTTSVKPKFSLKFPVGFPISKLNIEIIKMPSERPDDDELLAVAFDKSRSSLFLQDLDALRVHFDITRELVDYFHASLPEYLRFDPSRPVEQNKSDAWFYRYALRNFSNFVVRHFVIYCNICKVGSFDLNEGFLFVGEEKTESRSYQSPLNYTSHLEAKRGMRLLRELDFQKNWDFYVGLNGVLKGDAKTPIEIAVSNLTDLFDDSYDQSGARNLIWGFAGLESLLADSETSIGSQLRQKLVALFGNQVDVAEFEKEISDIYRFRSKIIHGNVKSNSVLKNLGTRFFQPGSEGKESQVAIWLLVAVIQYCFQNKVAELKFKTVVI
jgi:hypothetical protein